MGRAPGEEATGGGRQANRLVLLDRLPRGSAGAEIGVHRGDFSRMILDRLAPQRLYLVDPWAFRPDRLLPTFGRGLLGQGMDKVLAAGGPQAMLDGFHHALVAEHAADPRVCIVRATSAAFFADCRRRGVRLDWVYVDGDHGFQATLADIAAAHDILVPGGMVTGDDFHFANPEEGGRRSVGAAVMAFLDGREPEMKSFFRIGGQWGFRKAE